MKQEADNTSDPPYTEQQTEAVECIYTPITCTSQRAHGAKTRRKEWDGKRPHQVDQQRAIDSRDLYLCQSGSQTGSQLWFVPITSLTLFNLGFGQLAAQTTSVHWKRKWEIHICSTALNLNTEIHYMTCNLQTPLYSWAQTYCAQYCYRKLGVSNFASIFLMLWVSLA